MKNIKTGAGFTLIELLVVIAILAILAVAVVLVLNPMEFIRQSRDSARLTDLSTLNKALVLYQVDGKTSFGSSSVVYVSIPDSTSTCGNLGLPGLPSGWSYNCVSSTNYTKVDGSGWIPVNLSSISYGAVMAKLPIDPVNTTSSSQYYTYVTGGSWELTAVFESERYIPKASKDGGVDPAMFEIGSRLGIAPFVHGLVGYWKFDEGSGTTANDSSGFGNNGALLDASSTSADGNTPPQWTGGKVNHALDFDGDDDYVDCGNDESLNIISAITIEAWVNTNSLETREIITRVNGNDWGHIVYQIHIGDKKIQWRVYNGSSGGINIVVSGSIETNKWYHVVATLDNQYVRLYVNNVKYETLNTIGTLLSDPSIHTRIGTWITAYNFKGLIDEVRIYNRALSLEEIKNNMFASKRYKYMRGVQKCGVQ